MKPSYSMARTMQCLALGIYRILSRVGITRNVVFQRLFSCIYFQYKKHLEDPYDGLIRAYPQLFRTGNILDIGSHIGYTSILFSTVLGPGYQVLSFEPEQNNFAALCRNIQARQLGEKVIPVHSAVGSKSEQTELWVNHDHPGDHRIWTVALASQLTPSSPRQPVQQWSMDDFLAQHPISGPVGFIKIDVQGYEWPVCQGMTRTLQKNPQAAVSLEFSPDGMRTLGFDPLALLNFFEKEGYTVYELLQKGQPRGASYLALRNLDPASSYVNLLFLKGPLNLR